MSQEETSYVRSADLFPVVFDFYAPQLRRITPLPCKEIAIKNNQIMTGALVVYGDGNMKITRKKCMFPRRLYAAFKEPTNDETRN